MKNMRASTYILLNSFNTRNIFIRRFSAYGKDEGNDKRNEFFP